MENWLMWGELCIFLLLFRGNFKRRDLYVELEGFTEIWCAMMVFILFLKQKCKINHLLQFKWTVLFTSCVWKVFAQFSALKIKENSNKPSVVQYCTLQSGCGAVVSCEYEGFCVRGEFYNGRWDFLVTVEITEIILQILMDTFNYLIQFG